MNWRLLVDLHNSLTFAAFALRNLSLRDAAEALADVAVRARELNAIAAIDRVQVTP